MGLWMNVAGDSVWLCRGCGLERRGLAVRGHGHGVVWRAMGRGMWRLVGELVWGTALVGIPVEVWLLFWILGDNERQTRGGGQDIRSSQASRVFAGAEGGASAAGEGLDGDVEPCGD